MQMDIVPNDFIESDGIQEPKGNYNTDYKSGVPTLKPKRESEVAKTYYDLGRISARLDEKRDSIKQAEFMTLMQMAMLQKTKQEIQDVLAQTATQNAAMNAKVQMLMGGGAQAPPPLPVQPQGPGGMPPGMPEMGGPSAGQMDMGGPGMPPGAGSPDMGGMMPPQGMGQ